MAESRRRARTTTTATVHFSTPQGPASVRRRGGRARRFYRAARGGMLDRARMAARGAARAGPMARRRRRRRRGRLLLMRARRRRRARKDGERRLATDLAGRLRRRRVLGVGRGWPTPRPPRRRPRQLRSAVLGTLRKLLCTIHVTVTSRRVPPLPVGGRGRCLSMSACLNCTIPSSKSETRCPSFTRLAPPQDPGSSSDPSAPNADP